MRTYYLKLDGDIIIDAIEYPHENYIEVQILDAQLPIGINAGYYRWNGTTYTLDSELRAQSINGIIQARIDEYTLELITGGVI